MMIEEKKNVKKEEITAPSETTGDKSEANSLIRQANSAAERMEQATKRAEEERQKWEELEARRRLGGATGYSASEKEEKIDPIEYSKRILRGAV